MVANPENFGVGRGPDSMRARPGGDPALRPRRRARVDSWARERRSRHGPASRAMRPNTVTGLARAIAGVAPAIRLGRYGRACSSVAGDAAEHGHGTGSGYCRSRPGHSPRARRMSLLLRRGRCGRARSRDWLGPLPESPRPFASGAAVEPAPPSRALRSSRSSPAPGGAGRAFRRRAPARGACGRPRA